MARNHGGVVPYSTAQSLEPEAKALPNFPFFILHFHFFKGYRRDTGRTAGELRRQWIFYPLKRAGHLEENPLAAHSALIFI